MWTLKLLGPVRLQRAGDAQPLRLGRKGEAALACLAASSRSAVPRAALVDLLWGDRGAEDARNALRQWLFQLRRSLGEGDFVLASGEQLGIDAARCDVDLWRFADGAAGADPRGWLRAAMLYEGELAQGLCDPPAFGQWLAVERERVQLVAQSVLERLCGQVDASDAEIALRLGRRLLATDPLHEGCYRALMSLYGRLGMRAKAMELWHECRRALRTQINAEPSDQTRAAYLGISEAPQHVEASVATLHAVRGHAPLPPLVRDRDEAQAMARDYLLQGIHHYFQGSGENNAKAREAYASAARIDPASTEAAMCMAWTYFTDFQFGWNGQPAHNFARCRGLAEDLMRREPDHALFHALWGRVLLWQGDYRGAVDAFEYTVRAQPENAGMLSNAADACMRAGLSHRALELVQRAQAIEPGNRGVYLTVEGNTRFAMGDLDGAITAFESAWRRNPALCTASTGLATVYAEIGRIDEAREVARASWNAENKRMSLDYAEQVLPFADPGLRRRWVRAWELAGVPRHEPRLGPVPA